MNADLFYQLLNPLVFTVFALGFFAIQRHRTDNSAAFIGASYLVGTASFLADIVFIASENIAIRTGIAALYAITTILIVAGTNLYYRKSMPWRLFGCLLALHLIGYALLLVSNAEWIRSLAVNFSIGIMFLIGIYRIRNHVHGKLDKLLFAVGVINCAQCFIRPIGVALLAGGGLDNATHSESVFVITLHLFIAVSAIATAMSMFLVLGRDIVEELQMRSDTDPLSAILNRRGFEKQASEILSASSEKPATLAVIDIDHFKSVNDTYGHAAGDDVIRAISGLLAEYMPPHAITSRLGGEEFAFLIPDCDLTDGKSIANAFRKKISALKFNFDRAQIGCTISIGVTQYQSGETIQAVVSRADEALYLAKSDGRNCVKCEMDLSIQNLKHSRLKLEDRIEQVSPTHSNQKTRNAR